jgi:hypothetical protein
MPELTTEAARGMAEYIDLTTNIIQEQKQANANLTAELKQVKQQKQASALDSETVRDTVDNMIRANFIKQAEREDAITALTNQPGKALEVLNKLASKSVEEKPLPSLGKAAATQPSAVSYGAPRKSDEFFEQKFRGIASRL